MSRHHGHGGSIGVFAIVAAIAFAFGPRAARIVVGSLLVGVPLIIAAWIGMYGI